jgi:hypothetical protein
LRARVGGAASFGTTPAIGPSFITAIGLGRAWWSFDAEFRADLPTEATLDGYDVKGSYTAGGGVACLVAGIPYLCGSLWLGALRGEIAGGSPPAQETFHMLMGPRVGAAIHLTPWLDADGYVELLYAPTRTTLRVGGNDVSTLGGTSGSLGLGMVGRFP